MLFSCFAHSVISKTVNGIHLFINKIFYFSSFDWILFPAKFQCSIAHDTEVVELNLVANNENFCVKMDGEEN